MSVLPPHIQALVDQAIAFETAGDMYNAIKLLKRVVRLAPDDPFAYFQLGQIYKLRQEWKPALYYNKRAISLEPTNRQAWWNVALAATALKKWRIADRTWSKFDPRIKADELLCVRCHWAGQFELLWVKPIDPARGLIQCIPHPQSDRRYSDLILFDNKIVGYNIIHHKKIPVFDELGVLKRSAYQTFSCMLHTDEDKLIRLLEQLCEGAEIGFEVWSNTTWVMPAQPAKALPEYYGKDWMAAAPAGNTTVAFAAQKEADITLLLQNWKVISLSGHNPLIRHH